MGGAHTDIEHNENSRFHFGYEDYRDSAGKIDREGHIDVEFALKPPWSLRLGANYRDIRNPAVAIQNGNRADAGARLTYKPDEDYSLHLFGQATAYRTGTLARNDRVGVGGMLRVSDKVSLLRDVSWGASGWGGLASIAYNPTADDHYYAGYRLDPDHSLD